MARWTLVDFYEGSFVSGTWPVVEFPEEPAEGQFFCARWTSGAAEHSLSFVSGGEHWCLANERVVNRLRFPPFTRLNHGDVIEVDGSLVMLRGSELTWPSFPELEELVVRSGGSPNALMVLHDAVLERIGGETLLSLSGVLRPLLQRGIMLELTAGFPTMVAFSASTPLVAAWLSRWSRELTKSPLFQFLRRIELRVPQATQAEVDAHVRSLAMGLSAYRLPLLRKVHLDLPLDCTDYDSLEELKLLARSHQGKWPAEPEVPHDTDDVRLFEPPGPASWFLTEMADP